MVQMLDSWTLTTPSVKCFLGLQYIGFQNLWVFLNHNAQLLPHPKTMFDTCIPKFSQVQTRVVSTLLKWGGEKELQGFFPKGAIFWGKT